MMTSLRWRIVCWITAVVLLALSSMVLITRSVLLSQLNDAANAAVEQEIGEFQRFAAEGIDPETAQPFTSSRRLIEVYLSRQIPDRNETILGAYQEELIQIDLSALNDTHPAPMSAAEPLVSEVFSSNAVAGIAEDPQRGTAHWGRATATSSTDEDPAHLAVLFFTAESEAATSATVRTVSLLASLGLGAAVLIAWAIAGQILVPVRNVREVASSISNSDLTRRVPVNSNDEVGQLASTFNAMLDRIETAYNDQRQFVDDAGHELRTPITVVRGQLELLEHANPEQRARSIALATAELDRMARMVNDMLTLAVADSGHFLHLGPVDVAEMTIDIEDKARTLTERAQLVSVAEGEITADEQRITEAILELVNNAMRYSEGPIEIGSELSATEFRIWVRDHGKGIPEDRREQLFSRFSRGANTPRAGGAGLGLSIVQAIGQAHGGTAYVESAVGTGSTFGLALPLEKGQS